MATNRASKKPEEVRAWFGYQLKRHGSSFAEVGRRLGISRTAVRNGVVSPSPRVAEAVADTLGTKKEVLWPDRFAA